MILPALSITLLSLASSHAVIIAVNLEGKGGVGLLSTNENVTVTGIPGFGGEVGPGITYDNVTNVLTINVAWGLINGFGNLTGNASAGHIHGPTIASGAAAFLENRPVLFGLDSGPTWNNSATSGGITNRTITLSESQEAELLAGRYYINVHVASTGNGGGEIRGNLVVPETSTSVLGAAAFGLAALRRRRA